MILIALVLRMFAILSLALVGVGTYLVWSWWDLEQEVRAIDPGLDMSNGRLYVGLGLLAWSLFGRLPTLLVASILTGRAVATRV